MASNKSFKLMGALAAALVSFNVSAVPFFWTDWIGSSIPPGGGFEAQGTITTPTSSVGVTYTNANGIGFYNTGAPGEKDYWTNGFFSNTRNPATSPYTSSLVDNIPTGTDLIALSQRGNQTLQSPRPSPIPYLHLSV